MHSETRSARGPREVFRWLVDEFAMLGSREDREVNWQYAEWEVLVNCAEWKVNGEREHERDGARFRSSKLRMAIEAYVYHLQQLTELIVRLLYENE